MNSRIAQASISGLLVVTLWSQIADAATPSVDVALKIKPVQSGVDYETVPAELQQQCTVENISINGWSGWEVIAPDGAVLRRFADTDKDKKIDLWSYYKYGVEVYRDVDTNADGTADQFRWLGTGGSRWGSDEDVDGEIDFWKQISAEEVSAELVAALRDQDATRFQRLLISADEIESLGLSQRRSKEIGIKVERAAADFGDLASRQTTIGKGAQWVQFAASPPGVVPAGTDGSTQDLLVYENVVAMFEQDDQNGQLMVGTVIQVGKAWRLIELPSVGGDGEAIAQTTGIFFTPGGAPMESAQSAADLSEKTQQLVRELESVDSQMASASSAEAVSKLHAARAGLVQQLIDASANATERETWTRQLVDTLSIASQSGAYAEGLDQLKKVARGLTDDNLNLKAYADYQAISTEYVVRQTPDADFAKVQEWYLESLDGFVGRYPETIEAAQAWMQLALSKEFEDKQNEALAYYKRVATAFRGTATGEKAAGAVIRLESVGKPIELSGTTIDGKSFQLSSLAGKPVVIHYWATWCERCKQDMKVLRRLQASYQKMGLQVVGVNVDASRQSAASYLADSPLPWPQLFEEGGLETSRLANAFGVQTLPLMMLIDQSGKVVRHDISAAELDGELTKLAR